MATVNVMSIASGLWSNAGGTVWSYAPILAQQVDSAADALSCVDAARTEVVDFWIGATIVFTAGPNAGLSRVITDFDNVTDRLYWAVALPANCTASTYYSIGFPAAAGTYPNNGADLYKVIINAGHEVGMDVNTTIGTNVWTDTEYALQIRGVGVFRQAVDSAVNATSFVDAARTEAATDYWVGATLTITEGTNAGQTRVITAFNAGTDTLTWAVAMPVNCDSTSVYTLNFRGALVWLNDAPSAALSWVLDIKGHVSLHESGMLYVGTEDATLFPTLSVGPIPKTRTARIFLDITLSPVAAPNYHQVIGTLTGLGPYEFKVESWGAPNYQSGATRDVAAPIAAGTATAISADKLSLIDTAVLTQVADYWNGAWLEITAGTNYGEKREITDFDAATDKVVWSADQPMPLPCDATSVYTLTHNYQRAKLLNDYGPGSAVTVHVDRQCDWQTGDWVIIGGGLTASADGHAERVLITRVDAESFVCALEHTHKLGDFCFSEARNVTFESVTPSVAGTVDASVLNTVTRLYDAARTEANDYWNGAWLVITGGTNVGEARFIADFDSAADTLTWTYSMPVACDATSTYTLVGGNGLNYQGFSIAGINNETLKFNMNWTNFLNCGTYDATSGVIKPGNGTPSCTMPIVRNCVFRGYPYATYPASPVFVITTLNYIPYDNPISNVHVYHMGAICTMTSSGTVKLSDLLNNKFTHCTLLEVSSIRYAFYLNTYTGAHQPLIENFWMEGENRAGVAYGGLVYGTPSIAGFICRKLSYGGGSVADYTDMGTASWGISVHKYLKNGFISTPDGDAFSLGNANYHILVLENIRLSNIYQTGINFPHVNSHGCIVFMNNVIADGCNDVNSAVGGAIFFGDASSGGAGGFTVYDMNSKYGLTTPNKKGNIMIGEFTSNVRPGQYISVGCSYNTPTNTTGLSVPFCFNLAGNDKDQAICMKPESHFEAHNPILNGVASDSVAVMPGGGLLDIITAGAPAALPVASNIKMKMRPYSGVGRTFANIRVPLLLNLAIGVVKTISVYVHTNTTQAAGSRPALHIFGGGANVVKESNGTINAWTPISVTFTPQFSGPVMCWVSCQNTVVNPLTTTTGLPDNRGTVIVYADGFQVA